MLSRLARSCVLPRNGKSLTHKRLATSRNLAAFSSFANSNEGNQNKLSAILAASAILAGTSICATEAKHPDPTPTNVTQEEGFEDNVRDLDKLPTYTSEQVAENNGENGKIWMSYGGIVYDVTNFVYNHPGGSERIMLAAGGAVEPYWHLYRQHFATDLPMRLMEDMVVGKLAEKDQDAIDEQMAKIEEENEDPYAHEPKRSELLIVHGDQPMNAEVPAELLTSSYITPGDVFYIRHHHPVPLTMKKDIDSYELEIDLSEFASELGLKESTVKISLADLKKMPKTEIIATLQCSGNRRGDMNSAGRTSGTSWSQGAISTAKWGGVRLTDVLKAAGIEDPISLTEKDSIQKHLRMESLDGMKASINMEKATNPYGDVMIAYEMNGEPLPRDHGFPLRVIVPGFAAVRNVKWLKKIEISKNEAEGAWQQGLNYKTLPPSVTDAKKIDLAKMPSMTEVAVFSGITSVDIVGVPKLKPGKTVLVKAKGWAWSGGGRNIVRVDISGNAGESWTAANLGEGSDQKFNRAWAWTFWECEVPAIVKKDGTVEVVSKAVDLAFNSQPESVAHGWNVRGLGNNSWYRVITRG